jgi:hypothetical protein
MSVLKLPLLVDLQEKVGKLVLSKAKAKVVPLHAMKALGGRGGIAPHS